MRKTKKDMSGTSFYGCTITAKVSDMLSVLGLPDYDTNNGEDKVNYEWEMETEAGNAFTVYDYKEYRKLRPNDLIDWHIGGFNSESTDEALEELEEALSNI